VVYESCSGYRSINITSYAIYTVSDKTKESLKLQCGEHFFDRNYLIMDVYQADEQGEFNGFNYNHKF